MRQEELGNALRIWTEAGVRPAVFLAGPPQYCNQCSLGWLRIGEEKIACVCSLQHHFKRRRKGWDYWGMFPHHLRGMTFDDIVPWRGDMWNSYEVALRAVERWVTELDQNIALTGKPGNGKTLLASVAYNQMTWPSIWLNWSRVIAMLYKWDGQYDKMVMAVRDVPVMFIDDFGNGNGSEKHATAQEAIFRLINHRYELGLPTLVTSNATRADRAIDAMRRNWGRITEPPKNNRELQTVYKIAVGNYREQVEKIGENDR